MHLPNIAALIFLLFLFHLLLPLTHSHSLPRPQNSRRDAQTILSDLETISSAISSFNHKIASFSGSIIAALGIQNAEKEIENDISSTTSDVDSSSPFSGSDSQSITDGYAALGPGVNESVGLVVGKKGLVERAGVGNVVKGDLESLQNKADQLGVALGKKVDKSDQEMVSKTKTTIGDMLQEGILAFS